MDAPAPLLEIQPPALQEYPRTHLLGIPQELQDLIFDEAFDSGVKIAGAAKLRPLLTYRHIYHIANDKAWAGCGFNIKGLTDERVAELKMSIPSSVRARNIRGMSIPRSQMVLFARLFPHLPRAKSLIVTIHDDDIQDQNLFHADDDESERWWKCLLLSYDLTRLGSFIFFSAEAFKEEVVKRVTELSLSLTLARAIGGLDMGNIPNAYIKHEGKEGYPDSYVVLVTPANKVPDPSQAFHVWSMGPPYQKPVQPQSGGAERSTTTGDVDQANEEVST